MKTFDDLMKATLEDFPDAEVLEDNQGQLVIYTGLMLNKEDEVIPFEDGEE